MIEDIEDNKLEADLILTQDPSDVSFHFQYLYIFTKNFTLIKKYDKHIKEL